MILTLILIITVIMVMTVILVLIILFIMHAADTKRDGHVMDHLDESGGRPEANKWVGKGLQLNGDGRPSSSGVASDAGLWRARVAGTRSRSDWSLGRRGEISKTEVGFGDRVDGRDLFLAL